MQALIRACRQSYTTGEFQRLCNISWNIGISSPAGYNLRVNDAEMGYALYIDDIEDNYSKETLIRIIQDRIKYLPEK